MIIAISAIDATVSSEVDQRFGRAKFFALYNTETQEWSFLDNKIQLNAAQGAGIQSAETLAKAGVNVVLTGHCGPNAYRTLSSAEITLYTGASGSLQEALNAYLDEKLTPAAGADVEGHW